MTVSNHGDSPRWARLITVPISAGALAISLAACATSGSPTAARTATTTAAHADATVTTPTSADSGDAHAGAIDVCALLTPADASAVATQQGLSGDPTAKYKLITAKQPPTTTSYPTAACRFTIAQVTADNTGSEAIVVIATQPARYLDKTGTKLDGLGDEAYDEGPYVQVRVGDIILQSNENSATKDFVTALYRKMIPNVK